MMNIDVKVFGKHLAEVRRLKPSSIRRYRAEVETFFRWTAEIGQEDSIEQISRELVEKYLDACRSRRNGAQTLQNKLSALTVFFDFATWSRIRTDNPCVGIEPFRPENDLAASFSRSDVLRLFQHCNMTEAAGLRDTALLVLGAFCGLGSGEISRLSVDHLKDDGKTVEVSVVKPKGENRTIRIWETASIPLRRLLTARLVQGACKGDPLLASHRRNRLPASELDRLLKDIAARAGMRRPQLTITMLKNAHVEALRSVQGYDASKIKARMGWRSFTPLERHVLIQKQSAQKHASLETYWFEVSKWIKYLR